MTSFKEYKRQLSELDDQQEILKNVSSIAEAKNNVIQLQEIETKLFFIEKQLKTHMEAVRASKKNQNNSSFLSTLFKKPKSELSKKDQAEIKHRLQRCNIELTFANSIRSIVGQVVIPKLKAFIFENEQEKQNSINYRSYIKSTKWRKKAEAAKARAGNCCQVCNRSRAEVQLDAHHRTYERLGNEQPEDITVLCRDCHQLFEDEKKKNQSAKRCKKCNSSFVPINTSHHYCKSCYTSKKRQDKNIGQNSHVENSLRNAFCIRCRTNIKLNPQAPYCYACFKVWKKFENGDYREQHCHICGKATKSSMPKPVCGTCYKKHRKELEF